MLSRNLGAVCHLFGKSKIVCRYLLTYSLVQGALEWLEQVQDKSLEEINTSSDPSANDELDPNAEAPPLKPGETAQSLVCNDCGKKFRSQAQAEFHASKTEHVNFSESTEEIAPLTEAEKKAKLEELKQKLKDKRANTSEQDTIDRKRNDVSRLRLSGRWFRI